MTQITMMTSDDYQSTLQHTLQAITRPALEKLNAIKQSLPEKARQLMIGIHPGQGEEGFFSIVVHLDGPDLYVLNKAIEPYRLLVEVTCIDGQMQPDVPLFAADETDFAVNDVIVDSCMAWVEGLWQQFGGIGLPAMVYGEEGYGTVEIKTLIP